MKSRASKPSRQSQSNWLDFVPSVTLYLYYTLHKSMAPVLGSTMPMRYIFVSLSVNSLHIIADSFERLSCHWAFWGVHRSLAWEVAVDVNTFALPNARARTVQAAGRGKRKLLHTSLLHSSNIRTNLSWFDTDISFKDPELAYTVIWDELATNLWGQVLMLDGWEMCSNAKISLDSALVQTCLAHASGSARALTFSGLSMWLLIEHW